MADETFAIAMAIDVQTDVDTATDAIRDLDISTTLTSAHGMVLGDKGSGDAESGISIPALTSIVREQPVVAGSFTESYDTFLRAAVEGFAITFPLAGNGATASGTPVADEASPLKGVNAILQSAGLTESSGTAPDVLFKPSSIVPIYSTIKLWIGDLSFTFKSCLVDSLDMAFTPGGNGLATANFRVGSIYAVQDGQEFSAPNYGQQAALAAPVIENVAFTAFAQTRGFNTLNVSVQNTVEEFGDSNVATTGQRQSQTRRQVLVDGTIYCVTADSDAAYTNLVNTSAPTADLSFQVGTEAGGNDVMSAYKVEVNNLQAKSVKYNRIGTALVAELSGARATGTTAGSEFTLTFN